MCAVHDGRCSPWVMCSEVSGNQIHDTLFRSAFLHKHYILSIYQAFVIVYQGDLYCDDYFHRFITQPYCEGILDILILLP